MKKIMIGALLAGFAAAPAWAAPSLELAGKKLLGASEGEILDFSLHGNTLVANSPSGVRIMQMNSPTSISDRGYADFSTIFGAGNLLDATSVALDPAKRGFGVVSLVPKANGTTQGKIGFYDYMTGT